LSEKNFRICGVYVFSYAVSEVEGAVSKISLGAESGKEKKKSAF
jgi:hypothetical protein